MSVSQLLRIISRLLVILFLVVLSQFLLVEYHVIRVYPLRWLRKYIMDTFHLSHLGFPQITFLFDIYLIISTENIARMANAVQCHN